MTKPLAVQQAILAGDSDLLSELGRRGGKARAHHAKKHDESWRKYCAILNAIEKADARAAHYPSCAELAYEANEHICPIDPEDPSLTHLP